MKWYLIGIAFVLLAVLLFGLNKDNCADMDGGMVPYNPSYIEYNSVVIGDSCVNESSLKEMVCAKRKPSSQIVLCTFGCVKGDNGFAACRSAPAENLLPVNISTPISPPNWTSCADSDNGALSYTAGYVEFQDVVFEDKCDGKNITEYVCVNGTVKAERMSCLFGCRVNWQGIGECIPTSSGSRIGFSGTGPNGNNSNGNNGGNGGNTSNGTNPSPPPASPPPGSPPPGSPPPGPTPPGSPPPGSPPPPSPPPIIPIPEFSGVGLGMILLLAGIGFLLRKSD